ncbi:MAG TPA: PH domain-containing protein [Nocardioides sp.]|nr:PH domain-containing protein [Nocardioides sp.]
MTSTDPVPRTAGWQRLDSRMLLVHPVRDFVRFLPALFVLLVFGRSSDNGGWWGLVAVAVPVVLGLSRYLTTSYRITAGRIEVRHGLLNKRVLSAPLDRVRTVDLTASPIHRALGLVTVRIGTGQSGAKGEERLALDGLAAPAASALRERLLHLSPASDADRAVEAPRPREVLTLDLAWVRFAPFTTAGIAIAGAALGVVAQSIHTLEIAPSVDLDRVARLGVALLVVGGLVVLLVTVCVLAVVGYLLTNFGFRLSHTGADASWHLRRGLFTTRETTLDDARVSGVSIGEPLGLRLAGGARLTAIVTGLDKRQQGSSVLVPPAPRREVDRVAEEVLGVAGPVRTPLVDHGRRAHRRRWTRALLPAAVVAAAALVAAYTVSWWFVLVAALALGVGAGLARDRMLGLGHALVDGYLVARSGSLDRRRETLHTPSVIGWNLRATWFQRRVGLTDLVATTAGGRQRVRVLDLAEPSATALATTATPALLEPFLERSLEH